MSLNGCLGFTKRGWRGVGRKGWQRVGERLAKGWHRVGEGLAKGWRRVGGFAFAPSNQGNNNRRNIATLGALRSNVACRAFGLPEGQLILMWPAEHLTSSFESVGVRGRDSPSKSLTAVIYPASPKLLRSLDSDNRANLGGS